jgi:predicted component of type VI protein secretion system
MSAFIVQDRDGVRRVPIGRQMTIGRSANNDLLLNAMFASRRHARVWQQGERVVVEDLSSANGTFVNGRPLTRAQFLYPNDVLMMGDAQLTFVTGGDPADWQTPPQGTPAWDLNRTQPGRSFTPTEPVVARPFPAQNPARTRRATTQTCLILLLLAIVALLLLTILGVLAIYALGVG